MNINPNSMKYIITLFLIISILGTIMSQFAVLGTLDVDTKIGPADASLDADFYEHGVNYVISGNMSSGGLIGGIAGDMKLEIRDNKTFLTGLGEFQENIGLILDSYKDKKHTIKASILDTETEEFDDTKVWVQTQVDLIPWWPEGVNQKCSVTIILVEPGNCKNVVIDNVQIIVWRDFDNSKQVYTQSSEPLAEKSTNRQLSRVNESVSFDFYVKISEDLGRFGVIGVVELTIIDKSDNEIPKNTIINLGETEPMPAARTINIYTADSGESVSVILMVAAFPLSIISMIFMILALPFVVYPKRGASGLILFAAILSLLAIIFYVNGINTLVNMIDSVLKTEVRENFSWNIELILPIIPVVLLFIAYIFAFMVRPPKKKDKKKGIDKPGKKKKAKVGQKAEELPTFEVLKKPAEVEPVAIEEYEVEDEQEIKEEQKPKVKKKSRKKKSK